MVIVKKKTDFSGVEKSAILILGLKDEVASEVMKHLEPQEIGTLSSYIADIEEVPEDAVFEVGKEFYLQMESDNINVGGSAYVKSLLERALGAEKANEMMLQIAQGQKRGIQELKRMEPKMVADVIRGEHPQTIAVVMAHLDVDHGVKVLTHFEERLRCDVLIRVATMQTLAPGAIHELEESLRQHISTGTANVFDRSIDGVKTVAEMLNRMDSASEEVVLSELEKADSELASKIQEQMFVFADLESVDDKAIQLILKEISTEQLVLALRVTEDAIKDKFFNNMSSRASDMLQDDMETRGPVRLSEVEEAQLEILKTARMLEQDGKVTLGKGDEDVLV